MKKNMGSTDKVIRLLVAVVIAIVIFTHLVTGAAAILLGIVAGIFVLTSFVGVCPLYLPFGINTGKNKQ